MIDLETMVDPMNLVSIDLQSDFGFFRKPETNNTLNVSYNVLHKPAVLGLMGAVIGLKGYQTKGELPEYYEKLKDIGVGIAPLDHENGNFTKTPIKYSNTVGYANKGANFLTEELTLIAPKYRVFLMLNDSVKEQKQLLENLEGGKSEFIPYFGKNEFSAWWYKDSFEIYEFKVPKNINESIKIDTMFLKNQILKDNVEQVELDFLSAGRDDSEPCFMYFERLPVDFDSKLMQYQLQEMVFSNYLIKNAHSMSNIYQLTKEDRYVQLF